MKLFYLSVGWISLGLGTLGAFLPLLPSTCFILLAAFCFARSSERWHQMILNHRVFGPLVRNWQERGAISVRAKGTAAATMSAAVASSLMITTPPLTLSVGIIAICSGVLMFVLSRPNA